MRGSFFEVWIHFDGETGGQQIFEFDEPFLEMDCQSMRVLAIALSAHTPTLDRRSCADLSSVSNLIMGVLDCSQTRWPPASRGRDAGGRPSDQRGSRGPMGFSERRAMS